LWKIKRRILSVPKKPASEKAKTEEEYAYEKAMYTNCWKNGSLVGT
jgi:hypothetical protein